MKKSTFALVGILVALVGAYFLFVHQWHGPDNLFHIEDVTKVGKVEIEQYSKGTAVEKVTLERGLDQWTVDGKYQADPSKIDVFMKTLKEIRVLEPINPKGTTSALMLLKQNHLHVQIWDRDGNSMKDYLIGATNSTQTANIFKMSNSDRPYMVSKPAMEGYVSIYYSTKANDWRENVIFNIMGAEIAKVGVSYPDSNQLQSYALTLNGNQWMLSPSISADSKRAEDYISSFKGKVLAESFADVLYPDMLDSLLKRTPDATLRIETKEGKTTVLHLFVRPETNANFFAYLEDRKELVTIQHYVIDVFLKTGAYFVPSINGAAG
jgi:hypothetical protein